MKIFKELGCYDGDQPSSKRIAGMCTLVFTMVVFVFFYPNLDFEFFITWLATAMTSLGISSIDKFKPKSE